MKQAVNFIGEFQRVVAEEARRMHYGETEDRAIRGQTSTKEALELLEEGIGVVPLALPESAGNEGGGSLQ